MDVRLLRAVRFTIDYHRRFVLVHSNHPRLLRGPGFLSQLFSLWPSAFLLYAVICQHGMCSDSALPPKCVFSINRTSKVRQAEIFLNEQLQKNVCIKTYRRTNNLQASLRILMILILSLRRRSVEKWERLFRCISGNNDRHLVSQAVAFLLAYVDLRERFRRSPPAFVVCVSDLTARRIASSCAANSEGIPVFYWQNHVTNYWEPPFQVDAAVACGMTGYRQIGKALKEPSWICYRGLTDWIERPTPVPDEPRRIGIALNNYVEPLSLKSKLQLLKQEFPCSTLVLRPHPNSRSIFNGLVDDDRVCSSDGDVDDFARTCDLVLAGNTGLQIEVVARGTAVVHLTGLDTLLYDVNGFVAAGCIFGVESGSTINLPQVNSFYAEESWVSRAAKTLDMPLATSAPPTAPIHRLKRCLRIRN